MAASYPYYLLADSPEGQQKEARDHRQDAAVYKTEDDIRKGFVYKRVPHVTLKSIANNPDIKEGMTRQEIDAAIVRHADTELLFDKPYEDKKRIRVTGPFTVESLSPHRVCRQTTNGRDGERRGAARRARRRVRDDDPRQPAQGRRAEHRQERAARVRPARPVRRHVDPGDRRVHRRDGKAQRVAVSIGPEHGTVGPSR